MKSAHLFPLFLAQAACWAGGIDLISKQNLVAEALPSIVVTLAKTHPEFKPFVQPDGSLKPGFDAREVYRTRFDTSLTSLTTSGDQFLATLVTRSGLRGYRDIRFARSDLETELLRQSPDLQKGNQNLVKLLMRLQHPRLEEFFFEIGEVTEQAGQYHVTPKAIAAEVDKLCRRSAGIGSPSIQLVVKARNKADAQNAQLLETELLDWLLKIGFRPGAEAALRYEVKLMGSENHQPDNDYFKSSGMKAASSRGTLKVYRNDTLLLAKTGDGIGIHVAMPVNSSLKKLADRLMEQSLEAFP